MRALPRILLLAFLAGCALFSPPPKPAPPPLGPGEVRSAQASLATLALGKSTRAEVRAALGAATVVDFPSGYEVWIYRERPAEKDARQGGELVLLFEPAGTLIRARTR